MPEQVAALTLQVAADKKAENGVALDLRGLTVMCDYFIVMEAETVIQVRAVTEAIIEALQQNNVTYRRREGWDDGLWVLLDYGDVIVHVFRKEEREYYDIERLWGDAPRLTFEQLAQMAAQPN
ncbi:MAG: ribosome silencing factor [Limnochordia bacterium]